MRGKVLRKKENDSACLGNFTWHFSYITVLSFVEIVQFYGVPFVPKL